MRIREKRRRADLAALFFLLIFTVSAVAATAVIVATRGGAATVELGPGASNLNPAERLVLSAYLSARADRLISPAGNDPTPISFSVLSGETASEVAERLVTQGLVSEAQLLNFYLRYKGLDAHIEAGDFILRQTMTIPEVAAALTDASAREMSLRITEGWRLEQIGEALSTNPNLGVSASDFLALAGPSGPRTGGHSFLGDIPAGASLEGFLFPDTYLVRPGSSAADFLNKMLTNFDARLPAGYRTAVTGRGLTLYQAIIVASLIEREAVLDDERPLIASVILNRLTIGQPLEIDATVQYALGAPGDWWSSVAGLDYRSITSPYNTYYVTSLPTGPIANPGAASIAAVANAAQTNYLYYRARCDGTRRHSFAATYEEHLANACP
jgi:UPF0755 protein